MQDAEKNKPYFVIVHSFSVTPKYKEIYEEIQRIKKEEDFSEVDNNPADIPKNLPKDRKILVCGAYQRLYVRSQLNALKYLGYDASIYEKATVR